MLVGAFACRLIGWNWFKVINNSRRCAVLLNVRACIQPNRSTPINQSKQSPKTPRDRRLPPAYTKHTMRPFSGAVHFTSGGQIVCRGAELCAWLAARISGGGLAYARGP